MIPDPMVKLLTTENINSPTRLLTATWAFRILNTFSKGTTQRSMQESDRLGDSPMISQVLYK